MMAVGHKNKGAALAAPFLGTLLLCWQGLALAAAIDVNPVRLDLAGAGESRELRIRNEDLKPVSVEVTAWAWSQDSEGGDRLDQTEDILAVPPIFTIEPGAQQIVRVAFLGDITPGKEMSYRLLATELAPPAGPQGPAVSMRLQISLPVFVTAPGDSPRADISLLSTRQTPLGTEVILSNTGTAHTKLRSVQVTGSDGGTMPGPGQPRVGQARYLLPGSTGRFVIPGNPGTPLRVRISPESGEGWEHAVARSE